MKTHFHTIVTHQRPHVSDIIAIWLLKKFGEEMFPGVSDAKLQFRSDGSESSDLRRPEELEKAGILLIGIGGGRFDEHPTVNGEQKEGECEATLVAKELGLTDDPVLGRVLRKILKFALVNDTKGAAHTFDLASLTLLLHRQYPQEPEKVIEWVTTGLEAEYHEQRLFFTTAREEFDRTATSEIVHGRRSVPLRVTTIASDSELVGKIARSKYGDYAAVVIQQSSSGNVVIHTNKKYDLDLRDTVSIIRFAEQQRKGRLVTTLWQELSQEGTVEGAEEWYYHEGMQALMNGSLSHPDVPPTKLSLEEIKQFVRIGLDPEKFEPKRAPDCLRGVCTSTRRNPCPWYDWGLRRCRTVRFKMKKDGN